MRFLMLGDVYGLMGRAILEQELVLLIEKEKIDFVVANGENVTHGKSISKVHFEFLKSLGVDVVTSGNHIFKRQEVLDYIKTTPTLLKPLNMYRYTPGNGYVIIQKNNKKVCVVNLMGTSFMDKANNPYEAMDDFLSLKLDYDILLVDFHAEATAEKMAFAWNYDGIITTFVGTHTHVQTADERILPKKTAYISDLGMCGSTDSIIGVNPSEVIYKEKTSLPIRFVPSNSEGRQICGLLFDTDPATNKVVKLQRVFIKK